MHFVTQQRQQQQQQQQQQQAQQKSTATTTTTTRFVSLCKSSSQGALPKSLATAQSLLRQSSQQQQQQQRHKRAASLNLHATPMIKDIEINTTAAATTATTTTAAAAAAVEAIATAASSIEPTHATNMICDAKEEQQQQQQQQQQQLQQQQQQPELQQQQSLEQQQQQQLEAEQDDKCTQSINNGDRRDSISDDITINSSALNSKLLTIQEAAGTIERSSISLATTLTTAQTTSVSVCAASVICHEALSSVGGGGASIGSSSSSNSGSHHNVAPGSSIHSSPQANTPSISIAPAESKEQQQSQSQPTQSHSVDSNGQPSGSCTDSPSSRKSSTSSKGKPAKLSTSSSGRDEDAQGKLSESASTDSVLLRGDTNSTTSNEKPSKGTSRLSERAKKKSWYNVIYPNYKSRAEDFKKLFKDVPNDERLIVDYSCALQRDILVQGRLYVSQNYVCFHANIFSWETYVSIKWKDVTAITKEKTALVIPNAITISTAREKYFFATFASRDKSYLMLFRVWQNTLLNKQFSQQEIWRYVHNCYGDELGLTTDDEDYIDPTLDAADTETDGDFQTALDDLGGDQSNSSQCTNNSGQQQQPQQQSGNSSASSGGGSAAAVRKSKTKYFFNSSKSSNLNSSANASASGSDNKASDNTRKSNKKMKANAKELTLSSVKATEQSVAVTLSVPSTNSGPTTNTNTNTTNTNTTSSSTTATATTSSSSNNNSSGNSSSAMATTTATTTIASGGIVGGAGGDRRAEKISSNAATATAAEPQSHGSDVKRKVGKNQRQRDDLAAKNAEAGPTDVSDSSDSEENNVPFVPSTECTSTHEGRQIVHTILPIRVDTLFNFLFSKSKFLTDFHELRKSTDLSMGEWHKNDEGQNVRLVNVTVQLAASVGPKTSKVTEYQTMRECSKPGELYSIDVNSVNAGIPYADSFSVLIHFCLARTVDDHTMLSVHAQIKYKKSIWGVVKGFIEKNTWAGLEDFFGAQLHALQSETCIPPAKGKGRRPRRGTSTQARPMEEAAGGAAQSGLAESLDNWETKMLSAGGVGAGTAAGLLAHGAAGGGGGAGSRQQQLLLAAQQQQQQLLAGGHQLGQGQDRFRHRGLSLFVILLMCLLLALNVILLLKLWKLEEHIDVDLSRRARLPSLAALKELPNTNQDWLELLRQQELSHESELRKWHQVLQTAIELLKKVSIVCEKFYNDAELRQSIESMHTEF
ncbi:protein Aster-A [Drosophila novamexicana]|uniref:protein Aster-A n=1 Tax=Drosophila novamexicana TaxID=47314 RepID=UPI0011E5925B|nr:protein Aster-A [Drosophila novamexicana]